MSWLFPSPVENTSVTPAEIKEHMAPVQEVIGQMQGAYGQSQAYGTEMMDPMSQMNVQQRRMQGQQSMDQLALQNLLQNRQAASMGQSSGITQGQGARRQQQTGQALSNQFQQGMMQNRQAGLGQWNQSQGMLGQIGGMQMGIQENIAQADIARQQQEMQLQMQDRMMKQQAVTGLLGGAMSMIPTGGGGGATTNIYTGQG